MDIKTLTLKTVSLIALTTAQRVQTLVSLKINQMADYGEYVVFTIDELQKTSRPGHDIQQWKISSFPDKSCCVLHTLKEYLKITQEKRKSNKLFLSKLSKRFPHALWLDG